jgi:hypothetical protein
MEPETKKPKLIRTTALHDAIMKVDHRDLLNYMDSDQLTNIFRLDKDAARVRDVYGHHPLYLICCYRGGEVFSCLVLRQLIVRLIYHYPDAVSQDCTGATKTLY